MQSTELRKYLEPIKVTENWYFEYKYHKTVRKNIYSET